MHEQCVLYQLVPSLTGAEFDGCRVLQHSSHVYAPGVIRTVWRKKN